MDLKQKFERAAILMEQNNAANNLRPIKKLAMQSGGFTLIELLVVISIIGLLASIILVSVNASRQKSRDAARLENLEQLVKAFELYYSSVGSYPTVGSSGPMSQVLSGVPPLTPTYLTTLPATIHPNDGNCAATGAGSNDFYMYQNVTGAQELTNAYTITFCLGGTAGTLAAGPHTLTNGNFQ